jgi:hypothetical protein
MSIDARVVGISWTGKIARLTLEPREPRGCAGQPTLEVIFPSLALPTLLGREIWGGDNMLMCGNTRIGRRHGYGACELDNGALLGLPPRTPAEEARANDG